MGIPLTFLYAYLIESDTGPCTRLTKPANLYVLGILLAIVLPIFAYQGPYRRLEVRQRASEQRPGWRRLGVFSVEGLSPVDQKMKVAYSLDIVFRHGAVLASV